MPAAVEVVGRLENPEILSLFEVVVAWRLVVDEVEVVVVEEVEEMVQVEVAVTGGVFEGVA